jgi:hypothetical protein
LLLFQACNGKVNFTSLPTGDFKSDQNGEGYSGKPTPYNLLQPNMPCSEIGANGKPLPNSQIFEFSNAAVQLVRENCTDIQPRILDSHEYSRGSQGEITFQGKAFVLTPISDPFQVVAASCPPGKSLIPSAQRTNLLKDAINLTSPAWEHGGLGVALEGSLASLPLYRVERTDSNALESWHRMAQSPLLLAGEKYVFSFFAKPSSTEKVMFTSYYPNIQDFEVEIDLLTGAASIKSAVGVNFLSSKAQPFAGGLYINLYFEVLSNVQANIGAASSGQFLGSSISLTALQLEKISNFCTP